MPPREGMAEQASLKPVALDHADRDHLTGLWNRRRFEEELDRRVAYSEQDGEPLALLWIDVDGYRDVIQRHGPRAAEGLIRSISRILAKRLSPNEALARMGGDEFAAMLPGVVPDLLRSLADDLCTAVRDQSETAGTNRIRATISIGGAFLDPGTTTYRDALAAADAALHAAKSAGGDRAILHQARQGR